MSLLKHELGREREQELERMRELEFERGIKLGFLLERESASLRVCRIFLCPDKVVGKQNKYTFRKNGR